MPDQYTRTRAQLGTPALNVLRRAHVAVFGIGGVGGQAVEVLARSGVGELSLFDSDTVALSNLNRQLVALHSTLGQYKVDAMAARIADIDPTIIVHANRMFYNAETAPDVDLTQFDYVLDCIDTVSAKLLLIRCCKKAGVPILCSMGAAMAGMVTLARLGTGEPTCGEGYELNAIAAAAIGGASLAGGKGTILGTVLGALILSALKIGLVVVGMDTFYQYIATGLIIIVAVYFETIQKNLSKIMGKKKA